MPALFSASMASIDSVISSTSESAEIPAAVMALVSTLNSVEVIFGESVSNDVQSRVEEYITETFADSDALNDTVAELFNTTSRGVATVATLIALFTLSRAFAGLIRALDEAYEVEDSRPFWYVRLIAIDEALTRLERRNRRHARVAELRLFSGMSMTEIAEVVGVTDRTVKQDWKVAKARLSRSLRSPAA